MTDTPKYRSVTDLLEDDKWREHPQCKIEDIMNKPHIIKDYILKTGQHGEFAIILFSDLEEKNHFTTATGSEVILKRLKNLKEHQYLPCLGIFTQPEGKEYYTIV